MLNYFMQNYIKLFALLFAFGIALYFTELSFEAVIPFSLIAFGIVTAFLKNHGFTFKKSFYMVLLFVSITVLGYLRIYFYAHNIKSNYAAIPHKTETELFGRVKDIEILRSENGINYRVLLDNVVWSGKHKNIRNIRVKFLNDIPKNIEVNDCISFNAVLYPPSKPLIYGGYSFEKLAFFSKISAVGFSKDFPKKCSHNFFITLREQLMNSLNMERQDIYKNLSANSSAEIAGVLAALTIGYRNYIPYETLENYRISGLAHIVSISGFHISIVGAVIFLLIRFLLSLNYRIANRFNVKKFAAFISIFFITFYLFLSGAGIPTQRAYIMTLIALLAIISDRQAISLNVIFISGLLILLIDPGAIIDISFQMSFAAAGALIAFWDYNHRLRQKLFPYDPLLSFMASLRQKFYLFFYGIFSTSVIAFLATMPIAVYHFNTISLYSILANIIVVPVFIIMVVPGIILLSLSSIFGISLLSDFIFDLISHGITIMNWTAEFVASLPHARIVVKDFPSVSLLLFVAGILLFILLNKRKYLGIIPIFFGFIIPIFISPYDIMLAEKGDLAAFKINDTYHITEVYGRDLIKRIWYSHIGETYNPDAVQHIKYDRDQVYYYERKGYKVAYTYNYKMFYKLCRKVDLLITPLNIYQSVEENCDASVIDRDIFEKSQGVFIRLGQNIHIDYVK
jgi:competence protein ComEC